MVNTYSLKIDGEKKLSEHFKVKEFACKDGSDKILIDDNLIEVLESARHYLCKPIKVISGYRTYGYNEGCGGATNSYHIKGMASDIRCEGVSLIKLALVLVAMGGKGVGIYSEASNDFVHIDMRDELTIFKES